MKDPWICSVSESYAERAGTGADIGNATGQAAGVMDHESENLSGRPCDRPDCAESADP